jgi:hypothetical protein
LHILQEDVTEQERITEQTLSHIHKLNPSHVWGAWNAFSLAIASPREAELHPQQSLLLGGLLGGVLNLVGTILNSIPLLNAVVSLVDGRP